MDRAGDQVRSNLGQFTTVANITITALDGSPATRAMLCEILTEVVAGGGSVSFMHPLEPAAADAYWSDALGAAARGERVVLGAWDGDVLVGTVTLLLDLPVNQPHRAEVAKLMTRPSHRGRGIATSLMSALEVIAVERGRTLLVLDTAVEGGAASLYTRMGFTLTGEIPDYALKPHGGLTGTLIFWKRIGATSVRDNPRSTNKQERSPRP
jgi:ribosomal protein S18 acetylase RimI-like enzyme